METNERYEFLVLLVKAVLDNDSTAKTIFYSPEFKKSVEHTAKQIRSDFDAREQFANSSEAESKNQEDDPHKLYHLLVEGEEEAKDQLERIRIWLKNAEHIIISDPYILNPGNFKIFNSEEEYADYVSRLIPSTNCKVEIFTSTFSHSVKTRIKKRLQGNCQFQFFVTNTIHDRFIVRDKQHGKLIGTSLGGFGNKIFTILDLPTNDVTRLINHLNEVKRRDNTSLR